MRRAMKGSLGATQLPGSALSAQIKGNTNQCQENKQERHEERRADAVHSEGVHSFRGHHQNKHKAHYATVMPDADGVREYADRRTNRNKTSSKCAQQLPNYSVRLLPPH